MMDYKTVASAGDFPTDGQAHLCVLEFVSVTIPGDERSRTHPGHGYPESTETYSRLLRFETQETLEAWLLSHNDRYGPRHIVLSAQRVGVREKVTLEFDR